jgi:hypothetical protein
METPPALHDLEARARWHLDAYTPDDFEPPMTEAERRAYEDDEFDGGYLGEMVTCWGCGGEGNQIRCVDDLCHGQDWCMHGDNYPCRQCGGDGMLR